LRKRRFSLAIVDIIREKTRNGEYEFALPHFFEEMANDDLVFADIERVIATGRIRRRFRRDPRGIRYEVVGTATDQRTVAVICRLKETGKLLFITTYALE
jgi:hypothetical protein